ncbi:glycosyltransferase family 2 protein [Loigolactobacillus zhaoyuanensis]|uniref:Glycosyltransferase family 2 protein n=1 Tax=Loigolactobacillus zhaoyuanensis TaxID=2486017 RepID=A0ABW8UFV0_9LACO
MKLSVIIPVHNSENYICRCLDSVVKQSFNDFEIIIVDDGSIDNSRELIESYSLNDKRIQYFYIKNHGASYARNYGMDRVSGKYLMFIDADDYCDINYFGNMVSLIQHLDTDVAMSNYQLVRNDNIYSNKLLRNITGNGILNRDKATNLVLLDTGFKGFVWNKIYKMSIVNHIRFNVKISYLEDLLFNVQVFKNCERIGYSSFTGYYYCQNDGSASDRLNKDFYLTLQIIKRIVSTENRHIVDATIFYNLISENKIKSSLFKKIKKINNIKDLSLYNPVKNLIVKMGFLSPSLASSLVKLLRLFLASTIYLKIRKIMK